MSGAANFGKQRILASVTGILHLAITRRHLLHGGAVAAMAPAFGLAPGPAIAPAQAQAAEPAWQHALSLFGEVKYPAGFKRFDYVNPDAPKGGAVRQIQIGTFDNFNLVVAGVKGSLAAGVQLIYEALMTESQDEVSTEYGQLAEAVSHPEDFSWVTYRLRREAKWHDGKPVTPDDVIFSLNAFKQNHPQYSAYYRHVVKAEKIGDRDIKFSFDAPGNRELPQIVGQLTVLPKHWWEGTDSEGRKRDISATTLEKPLGSGAYRIKEFVPGRTLTLERVKDHWGRDSSTNVGRNNFDELRLEYFRDSTVALEAFKGDQVDWRTENSAKNWATAYDFPAVNDKRVLLEEFPNRSSGIMQAFAMNIRRDQFKDPRVRRALNFAFDFEEMNKQIFFGQYKRISSYFDGTELASSGLPQGGELEILEAVRAEVPPELFTKPYTNPVGGSPEAVRENLREAVRLMKEAGYRGARAQAGRQQDGRAVHTRNARCGSELRARHAVLQAFSGAAWHCRQRADDRSERNMKTGFAAGISMWSSRRGGNRCHPATNNANIGDRKRPAWRVRAMSSASRIRRSTS